MPAGHRGLVFDRGHGVRTDVSKREGINFNSPQPRLCPLSNSFSSILAMAYYFIYTYYSKKYEDGDTNQRYPLVSLSPVGNVNPLHHLDIQTVKIGLRVLYRPDPENLPLLYKQYGADYAQRVLPSIGNEVLSTTSDSLGMNYY